MLVQTVLLQREPVTADELAQITLDRAEGTLATQVAVQRSLVLVHSVAVPTLVHTSQGHGDGHCKPTLLPFTIVTHTVEVIIIVSNEYNGFKTLMATILI